MHLLKLAATALLVTSTSVAMADWVDLGGNGRLTLYYEPPPAKASSSATVWVMYDYKTEQVSSEWSPVPFSEGATRDRLRRWSD